MSESVIVAHGLWMPGVETALLRYRLDAAGFRSQLFRFPTLRANLTQNCRALARLAEKTGGSRLHFVGYSLGGIVTLSMLAETRLARVGRVVCIGSPLIRSRTADRFAQSDFGRRLVGRSLLEHIRRGGLTRWDRAHDLGIIAGTRSLGIGRIVDALSGDNDGTVAVDETKLPGATAHMTVPATHTQLLFDRETASQTIHFLRHGRFAAGRD